MISRLDKISPGADKKITRWAARRNERLSCRGRTEPLRVPKESWEVAKAQTAILGPPHSLICDVVRAISNASALLKTDDPTSIRLFSRQSIQFLVKVSPTITSALFFAAQEYYPIHLLGCRPLNRTKLVALFEPEELLAIVSATYFGRSLRKSITETVWKSHAQKLVLHSFLGGVAGKHVPGVGLGHGIILGLLDYLSFLIQLNYLAPSEDPKASPQRTEGRMFDPEDEMRLFSCLHHQIAYVIATSTGFHSNIRAVFLASAIDSAAESRPDPETDKWRHSLAATADLHYSGLLSPLRHGLAFRDEVARSINRTAGTVRAHPDQLNPWFLRSPSELPAQILDELELSPDLGVGDGFDE